MHTDQALLSPLAPPDTFWVWHFCRSPRCRPRCARPSGHTFGAHRRSPQCPTLSARQQGSLCARRALSLHLVGLPASVCCPHSAVLATQEKRHTETHHDGSISVFSVCETPRGTCLRRIYARRPCAHAPVACQLAWRLRGHLPLARHHRASHPQWCAEAHGRGRSGSTFLPVQRVDWQHQQNSVTTLPSVTECSSNRGAEQGDVPGTIQSALVLGSAREAHMHAHITSPFAQQGACDGWHVDDGQAFARCALFDAWLRTLDKALVSLGATRCRVTASSRALRACCAHLTRCTFS